MLESKGFDLWADGYDRDVRTYAEADEYPFAGYKDVLGSIYARIRARGDQKVLDLGCGTATLTSRLYCDGIDITAVDFSSRMLEVAKEKMPDAKLVCCDLSEVPQKLCGETFDAVVSTYAMHHLKDEEKAALLTALCGLLNPGGCILIGDIAFENREQLDACRMACGEGWDGDEIYFAADEWADLPGLSVQFEIKSHCAGVFIIQPRNV